MSKRKLSIKEREEKEKEKEEIRSAAKKLKLEREELEKKKKEEKQMKIDAIQKEKESALPATDWSLIPDVDWSDVELNPLKKIFISRDSLNQSLEVESPQSVSLSIVRGPEKTVANLSSKTQPISSLKSPLLPEVAYFDYQ